MLRYKGQRRVIAYLAAAVIAQSLGITYWHTGSLLSVSNNGSLQRSSVSPFKLLAYNENGTCRSYLFDALILSAGGVGSTSLFSDLAKSVGYERINDKDDKDHLKHTLYRTCIARLRDSSGHNGSKADLTSTTAVNQCLTRLFIYTFDQVAASVMSLYRRNYHFAHNKKLHHQAFPTGVFPEDVDTYADSQIDYLDLEPHFTSWFMAGLWESQVPILFLRSSFRESNATQVAVFKIMKTLLRADPAAIVNIEPHIEPVVVKPSKYLLNDSTSLTFQKLQRTYDTFQSTLDSLGYLTIVFRGQVSRLV
jgi:hypothetical protein